MDITCQRTITADGREILYSLERKQVKNLNLRVRKDGSVWVSADPGVPCGEIDAFVVSKAPYIQKALDHFHEMAQYRPQPKQYVGGETFNILGRGLRLQVTQAAKDSISADGVYIHLGVRDLHDIERKRRIVNRFLDHQCKMVFGDVMDTLYPSFQKYGVQKPSLRIRDMETRWGSCLAKKGRDCTHVRMYAVDSHICRNKKGTLNLYAPTTDQPFIGGIMALLKRMPEQNAAFERCVSFLAEMIEKYSGKVEFPVLPADSKTSWDSLSNPSSQTNSEEPLTNDMAA